MGEFVTKSDLLESESRVLKEDQRLRHKLGNKVQEDYLKIDEKVGNNDKELALLKQSHNTMSENIQEIKEDMKEGFSNIEHKMEEFLKGLPEHFATKSEHKNNEDRLSKLEKGVWWIIGLFATGIVGAIINLIITTGNT